jgi:hypothetical protein
MERRDDKDNLPSGPFHRREGDTWCVASSRPRGQGMKGLAHPSFFRIFDLLLSITNPGLHKSYWAFDGVDFERERHSFTGSKHGMTIEIVTLTREGRRGWSLMVTKEYWWAGPDNKPFKNLRWARPISGQRSDMLGWMRSQEAVLGRSFASTRRHSLAGHSGASESSARDPDAKSACADNDER